MALWNCRIVWPNGNSNSAPIVANTADEAKAIYEDRHRPGKVPVTITAEPAMDPDGRTEQMLTEYESRRRWA